MEKTETTTKTKKRTLQKVSVDVVKLSDLKTGDSIEGTFNGRTTGPWIDKQTGEQSELVRLHFTREDGTKFITFEDGGLRNAMANAMVKEGDYLKIVKCEQVSIGGGRKSNQYDLFTSLN